MSNSDVNFPPGDFADRTDERFDAIRLEPENRGAAYDDIFKVSHCQICTWEDVVVTAGHQKENAQDVQRNSWLNRFRRLVLDAGKQGAILVKGGSSHNKWDDVLIRTASGHTDVMIGGYSGQSRGTSENNTFNNIRRKDGKPVRYAFTFFRARKPKFTNSKVEYQFWWSLVRTVAQEWAYLTRRTP